MTEELIKFETATLAKKKGFDWYTSTYIDDEEDIIEDDTAPLIGAIPAPTQSLLQRWLREVHKIHITITSISQESWQYHITKVGDSLGKLYNEDYDDYEEALEDALVDALNLIP